MSTRPAILDHVAAAGHAVFEKNDLNLNLIGVRSANRRPRTFDDTLHLVYKRKGQWIEHRFGFTTDPGARVLAKPTPGTGGAPILVPGQYRSAWMLGYHHQKDHGTSHPALVQRKPVKVRRDNDLDPDLALDGKVYEGMFAINIHAPSHDPLRKVVELEDIGPWGEGCQVHASTLSYQLYWGIVLEAADLWGPFFTYTLLAE